MKSFIQWLFNLHILISYTIYVSHSLPIPSRLFLFSTHKELNSLHELDVEFNLMTMNMNMNSDMDMKNSRDEIMILELNDEYESSIRKNRSYSQSGFILKYVYTLE